MRSREDSRRCAVTMVRCVALWVALAIFPAFADDRAPGKQSLEDAWWTGPILAASAATLPQGHFLIEPYLYDSISQARFDEHGDRHDEPDTHFLGSQTYLLYGLYDRVSVGLIPRFGFRDVASGHDSAGLRMGDLSAQAQFRLTQFNGALPTLSVVMQLTLPTGKHDALSDRPSDAMGTGAYSGALGLYSQHFFWMPSGRVLRTRFNVLWTKSDEAAVRDVSVYGTADGFIGHAQPGDTVLAIAAAEYSITRNWVFAFDLQYQHDASTRLAGEMRLGGSPVSIRENFRSRESWSAAPAVEYNFNGNVGMIVGAIYTLAGRNSGANITPVVAVNIVY